GIARDSDLTVFNDDSALTGTPSEQLDAVVDEAAWGTTPVDSTTISSWVAKIDSAGCSSFCTPPVNLCSPPKRNDQFLGGGIDINGGCLVMSFPLGTAGGWPLSLVLADGFVNSQQNDPYQGANTGANAELDIPSIVYDPGSNSIQLSSASG